MKAWRALLLLVGLLALRAQAADVVYYIHTDALGSPVAMTDANRNVVERTQYAPYGEVLNRSEHDGPGYTGHEEDPQTGLTNMQQRYDDKVIGRMISPDPMDVDPNTGANFNRYAYANDNPYRFTDPDGRQSSCAGDGSNTDCGGKGAAQAHTQVDTRSMAFTSPGAALFMSVTELGATALEASTPSHTTQGATPTDNAPNRVAISSSKTENKGSYSTFHYQIENSSGNALTGDGYSVEEHLTPHSIPGVLLITSEDRFVSAPHGDISDDVGFPNGVPLKHRDDVLYQTFTIRYAGTDYNVSTMFKHEMRADDGKATNTVTGIVP